MSGQRLDERAGGRRWWARLRRAPRAGLAPPVPEGQLALITALDVVATAISSAPSVQAVLGIIVEAAKRFTGTEKVLICLVEEHAHDLTLDPSTLVVRGARDSYAEEWWSGRLPAVADETLSDGRPYLDIDHERGAWILAVPVRTGTEPLGVLVAINATSHRLRQEHTAFLSILGAFAAVAIVNARLAEDSRYALIASERERIAREMHDGIAQSLFSISLGMEVCRKQVHRDPEGVAAQLEELQDQLELGMSELRRYIYDLRPAKLAELGLERAIGYWLRQLASTAGVRTEVRVSGVAGRLSAESEACLYRIAREAASNATRHGAPSTVAVSIDYREDGVEVTVTDDGRGFDVSRAMASSDAGDTVGLRSLRDRVDIVGGTLSIESTPGAGCRVRSLIPYGVV